MHYRLVSFFVFLRWLVNAMIIMAFSDMVTVSSSSLLPYCLHHPTVRMPPPCVWSGHLYSTVFLSVAPLIPPSWQWPLFILLVSAVTPGYVTTSEDWELAHLSFWVWITLPVMILSGSIHFHFLYS